MAPYDLTLNEMLADPIVRQLMNRDGVGEEQVRDLSQHVRRRRPKVGPQISSDAAWRIAEEPRSFTS